MGAQPHFRPVAAQIRPSEIAISALILGADVYLPRLNRAGLNGIRLLLDTVTFDCYTLNTTDLA